MMGSVTTVLVGRQPPNSKPFLPGYDPRRSKGPVSKAEREFKDALEAEHIPKASGLLAKIYDAALIGLAAEPADTRPAELFFKICGLIRRPSDDAELSRRAGELLSGMIAEAQARREAAEAGHAPPGDTKTIDVGDQE